jgi:hypothetical protein
VKKDLYHKTVYIFQHGERFDRRLGEKSYRRYLKWGFTLDSTGKNLPQNFDWKYKIEVQPGHYLVFPLDNELIDGDSYEPMRRGLDEKGWYIGHLWNGAGQVPLSEVPIFRDPKTEKTEEQKLSGEARDYLRKLLKDP